MCFTAPSMPKDPPPIQKPESISDPAVQSARADQVRRQRDERGARSTILTRATLLSGADGTQTKPRGKTAVGK